MVNQNLLKKIILATFFIIFTSGIISAQSRSRIMGVVKDSQTKEPLIGVSAIVKGTTLGNYSDVDGKFIVINVPVGTYDLQISMVGYTTKTLKNLVVSADRVTTISVELEPTTIQGQEVVVTAKADELHKEVSNTQMVISSDQLQDASGVRQINAFLSKMPGVSESNGFLTIRGGSADQTGTMVNGLAYNNAAVGNAETSIPMSAIDQVSLLSGGYNAEYGNFRSGLINITTKSGKSDGYHGTISISKNNNHIKRFGGNFFSKDNPYAATFIDPNISFLGSAGTWPNNADPASEDYYNYNQHPAFTGWIAQAKLYNYGKPAAQQASAMDLYYLFNWLMLSTPDYDGLSKLPDNIKQQVNYYDLSQDQKNAFANHQMKEGGSDWNFDGGFGGPVPFIGKFLGDATFYISNTSQEQYYNIPVVVPSQKSYTTLGTIKATPAKNLTVTLNTLWKRQIGVSPIRPAYGDAPDASNAGGFMPIDNTKIIYNNYGNWFDPPFFPMLSQTTLMNGLTINHVLSPSTYWELTLSYLSIEDQTPNGDNRDSSVVTQIGKFLLTEVPYGKLQFGSRAIRGTTYSEYVGSTLGIPFQFGSKEGDLYDKSKTNQIRAKFDIASQLDDHHYLKGGIEYNYIELKHNFWEKWNSNYYNAYEFNYERYPSQTGMYIQDQINYNEIVANIGVRMDYYYGGGGLWPADPFNEEMFKPQKDDQTASVLFSYLESGKSYIWDVWSKYNETHPGFLQPINNYLTFSPRIGVSFPVTTNSKFYFNYGHFRSNPPYYTMYQFRYRYDKNGLYNMTNPNMEPPRTISYELGIAYNFHENMILTISGYGKDVTGEAGSVTYQTANGVLNYSNQANNQYQDIQGLEINITKNDNSWFTGWINFDYMLKKNGLTGKKTISDKDINNDQAGLYAGQETKTLPRPSLNMNLTFRSPKEFGPEFLGINPLGGWDLTLFATYTAGDYFTWNPLGKLHFSNNVQWPDYYMLDLKLTKSFEIAGHRASFYLDISNVLNLKVNAMNQGYAFFDTNDRSNYLKSLHLPMYDNPEFDALRSQNPGQYIAGNDKIGDLRSSDKPYINDPNLSFWTFKQPRDIWFGFRIDF